MTEGFRQVIMKPRDSFATIKESKSRSCPSGVTKATIISVKA